MQKKMKVVALTLSALALAACDDGLGSSSAQSTPESSTTSTTSESSTSSSSSSVSNETSVSSSSSSSSSEDVSNVTVTLIHYQSSVEILTIEKGTVFADPGEDGADIVDTRWDGWFNGDTLYDFSQAVNEDLTLTAKRTRYVDIPVKVNVEIYDDWQEADGEVMRGNVIGYSGHYMEEITLAKYDAVFNSTLRYNLSSFNLYDEDGNLMKENVQPGDKIVLSKEGTLTLRPTATVKTAKVTFAKEDSDGNAITVADGTFADATIDLNGNYTLPSDTVTPADGYVFLGWYRKEDSTIKEIFRPGETIPNSVLVACKSTINFVPYLRSNDEVKDISTPDDLVGVDNSSTEVLNIKADLDFHAEDGTNGTALVSGIGAGDFEGIILGNGHTISGYTVGEKDNGVSAGLIDSAYGDSVQIFDLKIDDVEVNTTYMTGASPLVGEADTPVIVKNVTISNVTYNTNVDAGTKPAIGGVVGYNWGYDLVLENVNVSNMDTTHAIVHADGDNNVDGYASSTKDQNKVAIVGGLIGHEDDADYGSRIVNCTVKDTKLIASSYDVTAYMGGIMGAGDGFAGIIEGNTISNVTIKADSITDSTNTKYSKLGGIIGDWNNESARYSYDTKTGILPVSIARNHVDVDISTGDATDTSTLDVFVGGIAGDMLMDGNGKGSNCNTCFTSTSDNVVNVDVTTEFKGKPRIFAGGLYGDVGMDCSDYRNFVVCNDEVHVNLDVDAANATALYAGGLVGMFDSAGSSGMIVDGVTIDGNIVANSNSESSFNLAGLAAHAETETGGIDVNHVLLNVNFPATASYGSLYGYASTNVSQEGVSTGLRNDNIFAASKAVIGTVDAQVIKPTVLTIDADHGALAQTGFSSYYWKDDATGHLALK